MTASADTLTTAPATAELYPHFEFESDDVLLDIDAFPPGTEPAVFAIDSEDRANWLLRKLGNIAAERDRVKAQAAAILADLDKDEQNLRARFEGELQDWVQQTLTDRKGKTLKMIQGSVSLRTVPGGLRITDPRAALEHAQTHYAGCVKMEPKLDTTAYRETAQKIMETSHGELLPGVEMVPTRESMSIKFGKTGAEGGEWGAE